MRRVPARTTILKAHRHRSAECAIPKRSHEHRELSTASRPGRRPANVHAVTAARGHAECTGCAERRSGPDRAIAALGLNGRGVVAWARLCRCLRCSTPTALSTPQLRRPDPSTPLGSPVPRNARPAHRAEPEVPVRNGGRAHSGHHPPLSPAREVQRAAVRCMNAVVSRRGRRPTLTRCPGMTPILLARWQSLA
jgi:hypothetical protein